ncbi:hypothetical protein [Streptococcus sp. CSL10205-OR2]|uniref:hypothetical protein n=1 Tax=Streptococcus sp. CSL10205-OR2 TaxID=2980558 RepID=UPI0021D84EF5|nr:hypothetical protein [Streptococcus sp. CSL10205-OR2]MCU9534100.1 hypothetical protein [Streptococcus sp. CSL10205-OR2]
MKQIFSAVFESVWKRKETKLFLAFSLYPLIYFVASFFGQSNFMQIANADGIKVGYLDFADMMMNSMDMLILPTLALYFLTISVFRRETDDHTMFLYKDINRKNIYLSKYFSLIIILVIYFALFFLSSLLVHYTRVAHLDFGTTRFMSDTLYYTLLELLGLFTVFLKGIVSISVASLVSLRFGTGATMTTAIVFTIVMMIMPMIGGPMAMLFPSGYKQFIETVPDMWIGFVGSLVITLLYAVLGSVFSLKKFKHLEF